MATAAPPRAGARGGRTPERTTPIALRPTTARPAAARPARASAGRHVAARRSARTRSRTLATVLGLATALVAAPVAGVATAGTAEAATGSTWDALAACESGGNWSIRTGNGYHGGLQFSPRTWAAFGGTALAATADRATREQQIEIAERVLAEQGWGAWPGCSRKLGLTAADAAGSAASAPAAVAAPTAPASAAPSSTPASGTRWTVAPGDTLSKIARATGSSWQAVYAANSATIGANPNALRVGQTLTV